MKQNLPVSEIIGVVLYLAGYIAIILEHNSSTGRSFTRPQRFMLLFWPIIVIVVVIIGTSEWLFLAIKKRVWR